MDDYLYITLRKKPDLKNRAAEWFHCKWGVPKAAYLECMEAYLDMKRNTAGICVWTAARL